MKLGVLFFVVHPILGIDPGPVGETLPPLGGDLRHIFYETRTYAKFKTDCYIKNKCRLLELLPLNGQRVQFHENVQNSKRSSTCLFFSFKLTNSKYLLSFSCYS